MKTTTITLYPPGAPEPLYYNMVTQWQFGDGMLSFTYAPEAFQVNVSGIPYIVEEQVESQDAS